MDLVQGIREAALQPHAVECLGRGENYKITVKPGCDASVADIGLSTWRLDSDGLLLSGPGGSWRFSESDATTWERIPATSDPLVLMRQ